MSFFKSKKERIVATTPSEDEYLLDIDYSKLKSDYLNNLNIIQANPIDTTPHYIHNGYSANVGISSGEYLDTSIIGPGYINPSTIPITSPQYSFPTISNPFTATTTTFVVEESRYIPRRGITYNTDNAYYYGVPIFTLVVNDGEGVTLRRGPLWIVILKSLVGQKIEILCSGGRLPFYSDNSPQKNTGTFVLPWALTLDELLDHVPSTV